MFRNMVISGIFPSLSPRRLNLRLHRMGEGTGSKGRINRTLRYVRIASTRTQNWSINEPKAAVQGERVQRDRDITILRKWESYADRHKTP